MCTTTHMYRISVYHNFRWAEDSVTWVFDFHRDLSDDEIRELATLISMLKMVFLSVGKNGRQLCAPNSKGSFSIKSFYDVLFGKEAIMLG